MIRLRAQIRHTICIAVAIAAAAGAARGQAGPSGPRIKCAQEVFNFGYVPQDATVSHTYWLKNAGTEEVIITEIKPNCGCTRIPPSDSSIAVGDSLPIEMVFASRNMSGKVEKFTRIGSNAAGRVPALTFQASVFKTTEDHGPITAVPAVIELTEAGAAKFNLKNSAKTTVTVQVVDVPAEIIRLDWNELSLAPDESRDLSFELLPQEKPTEFSKSITLEVNDPEHTRLTIPITNVKKE